MGITRYIDTEVNGEYVALVLSDGVWRHPLSSRAYATPQDAERAYGIARRKEEWDAQLASLRSAR